jgi:hypothetical protein
VNTRPLAYYTLKAISELSADQKILIVDSNVKLEVENELHEILKQTETRLEGIPGTNGVIETLRHALSLIPAESFVKVILVTTIPDILPQNNEIVIDSQLSDNEEWSIIRENNGQLDFIKKSKVQLHNGYAFTGSFSSTSIKLIEICAQLENEKDLIEVVKYLNETENTALIRSNWIDCGHEINYHQAKKCLINSRSFNQIEITETNTLIKRSDHKQKLQDEVTYIKSLPDSISLFYPRIFSEFEINRNQYAYEMSYYSLPNVAELMLYWDLSRNIWKAIFIELASVLRKFKQHNYSFSPNQHKDFYLDKFNMRVNDYLSNLSPNESNKITSEEIVLNNKRLLPLHKLYDFIEKKVTDLFNANNHCIMHGDFCFNNILYDIQSNSIKLIDARGSFSSDYKGIYGDSKYDLSKLLHSSMFGYDYIVNDLYSFTEESNHFFITLNWRENRELLSSLSRNLTKEEGYDFQDIKFVVGLLFLSMTPLHHESPIKQKVMYLHGLNIINEIYNEQ